MRKTQKKTNTRGTQKFSSFKCNNRIIAVIAVVLSVCVGGFLFGCASSETEQSTSEEEQSDFATEKAAGSNLLAEYLPDSSNLAQDVDSVDDESSDNSADDAGILDDASLLPQVESTPEVNEETDAGDTAAASEEPTDSSAVQVATVERITDGDTLRVNIDGSSYSVRLIGVDAPESVHPDESRNTQEGGVASDFTKSIISVGQTVYLQKDTSETDQYGRLLRYMWLEDPGTQAYDIDYVAAHMLNGILVYQGYAEAKRYPPDTVYAPIFEELQSDAVANGRGVSYMWE